MATLKFLIFGEDKTGSKALKGVGDQAEHTHSKLAALGGALGSAGLFAGGAAAAGLGALGAYALKSASDIQTATSNLTTLTGSASKAKDMVAQLNAYGNATTFDTSGLAEAAQQMLTFGISTKDVMPDIKMLGDISMGNQEKLKGLALVFAQVQGAGHLMGGDLNQMINNGFNPLQDMSKRTGKSMGELRQEMQKGQISFADVQKSMEDATKKGGQFYQGASNGSKTLAGAWGNLTGTISSGLGMALQPVLPVITQLMGKLSDLASVGIPAMEHLASSVGQKLKPVFEQTGPAITAFGNIGQRLMPVLEAIGTYAKGYLGAALSSVKYAFETIRSSLERNRPELEKLGKVLLPAIEFAAKKLGPILGTLATVQIRVLGQVIGGAIDVIGGMVDGFTALINAGKKVGQFFHDLPGKITGAVAGFPDLLIHAGESLITGLIHGLTNKLGDLGHALAHITDFIKLKKGPPELDRVLLTPAGESIMQSLINGILNGQGPLAHALGKVSQQVKSAAQKLSDDLQARSQLKSTFAGFAQSLFGGNADGSASSISDILSNGANFAAQAQQYRDAISKLISLGASKATLADIAGQGVGGMSSTITLAGGSAAQIAQVNAYEAQQQAALVAAGGAAGNAEFGSQINRDLGTLKLDLHMDGKSVQKVLLKLKRENGGLSLGLA